MCEKLLYLQFSECENSHLFDITLDPSTKYYYSIVGKFGNKYNGEVVTNQSGYFSLNNDNFPAYFFNKNAGNFILTLKENSASCDYLNIVKCGNIYDKIIFSFIEKEEVLVQNYISSFTAGTSTINFTNNGGDDWDIDFKIAMSSQQLPSGYTAPNYDVNVYFYLSGTGNAIDSNTGVTIDKTVNASGNGAGVYVAQQVYNILDSNLSSVGIIAISSLFKVNASGILLAYFMCNGVVVNSVNGLVINVTADINQSENYPIEWYSYDSSFNPTLIGTGLTANLTLPTDCAYLIAQPILDSVFTVDFPNQSTNISTVTIN